MPQPSRSPLLAGFLLLSHVMACGPDAIPPPVSPAWESGQGSTDAATLRFGTPKLAAGTVWTESQTVIIDGKVSGLGGSAMNADLHVEKTTLGRVEVLEIDVTNGLPTRMRIAVDKASQHVEIGSRQQHSREAVEGQTYLAEHDGEWSYERVDGQSVSDEEASALSAFGLGWQLHPSRLLPAHELRAGDRLRLDDTLLRHLGIRGDALDDVVVTFEGPVDDVGRFRIAGNLAQSNDDIAASGRFEGQLDLRPQDSWPLAIDLDGKLALSQAESEARGTARLQLRWQTRPE